MSSRTIDLSKYDVDPRVIAWLEANGIDPSNSPADQEAHIADGTLTIQEWELTQGPDDTRPHRTLNSEGNGWVRVTRTLALASPPEDHGL